MNEMFYRQSALDCIANGLLKNYRNGMYLYGAPRSIPIEEIIEVEYKLTIEYVKLRKSGNVLGQTVFENCSFSLSLCMTKKMSSTLLSRFSPERYSSTKLCLKKKIWADTGTLLPMSFHIGYCTIRFLIIRRKPPPRQRQKAILKPNGRQTLLLLRYLCRKCR